MTDSNGSPVAGAQVTHPRARRFRRPSPTPRAATASPAFRREPTRCGPRRAAASQQQTQTLVVDADEILDFTLTERQDAFGYNLPSRDRELHRRRHRVCRWSATWSRSRSPLPFPFTLYGQTYEKRDRHAEGLHRVPSAGEAVIHQYADPRLRHDPTPPSTPSGTTWWSTAPRSVRTEVRRQRAQSSVRDRVARRLLLRAAQPARAVRDRAVRERAGPAPVRRSRPTTRSSRPLRPPSAWKTKPARSAFQYSTNEATVTAGTAVQFFLRRRRDSSQGTGDRRQRRTAGLGPRGARRSRTGRWSATTSTNSKGRYRMQLPVGSYIIQAGSARYGMQESAGHRRPRTRS